MPHKKADSAEPDHQQKALEHKIDELLSLEPVTPLEAPEAALVSSVAKPKPVLEAAVVPADTSEPIDIFKGVAEVPAVVVEAEAESEPEPEPASEAEPSDETVETVAKTTATIDLDDKEVDKAVDDIMIHDGDALLAAEDAVASLEPSIEAKPKPSGLIKKLFK